MSSIKPLNLVVAMGLTLDIAGAMYVYGMEEAKGANREVISAAILLAVALLCLVRRPQAHDGVEAVPVLAALLPLAAALISISDLMSFVATGWTVGRALLFGGASLLLFALAVGRARPVPIALVSLVFGAILRYMNTRHIPIEPARGDMLPLVQQALANLAQGRSPYATYRMPWELPLTYLPLTWLAYAPTYLLGLDIRWTNVVAEIGVLGAALFVAHYGSSRTRTAAQGALVLWAWIFLSPTVMHWDLATTAPIGWAAIAWVLALSVTARPRPAAVALGLAAATTPFTAVFLPFIALRWWREAGLQEALRKIGLAALVAAVIILPWLLWAPNQFLDGTVRWFNNLERFPRAKWKEDHTWYNITGFSGMFWIWGLERWLKPIQLALVTLVAGLYAARGARRADLLLHAAAAFLLFMLFNPVLWPYLYNPALVTAVLAVAAVGLPEPAPAAAPVVATDGAPIRRQSKYPRSTT